MQQLQKHVGNKKGTISFTAAGLLFMLLLTIAEIYESGLMSGWYLTVVLISAVIAFWGYVVYIGRQSYYTYTFSNEYNLYIAPVLVISMQWIIYAVYNIFLYAIGMGNIGYMKSSCIQELIPLVILTGAGASCFIFRKNALKYIQYTIWLNYFLVFVKWLFFNGLKETFEGILSIFSGLSIFNPFETYAGMNYAIGLLVIYYLNTGSISKSEKLRYVALLLVLVFLNGKRSVYLAVVLLLLYKVFSFKMEEKTKYRFQAVISVLMLLVYLFYIYLIDSGIFSSFGFSGKINFMGRAHMWMYIAQYINFTPAFLGNGFSFATLTLEKNNVWSYNNRVYSMHGEILAMYTDLGFLVFVFWMVYNLLVICHIFKNKYGYKVSGMYWNLTMYLFILYLTERATNIFILQTVYMVLVMKSIQAENRKLVK